MPAEKQPAKKQAPKKQAATKQATKKQPAKKQPAKKQPGTTQPAKKQPGGDLGTLQQAVLDAAQTVVTDWVESEKMTGNDKLDAALQQLTQAYRAWEGNR
jgi:hypothetical protein